MIHDINVRLSAAIQRKEEIDAANRNALNLISYDRWLTDAVELLLRIEMDQRSSPWWRRIGPE